jgi:hypothetical protein
VTQVTQGKLFPYALGIVASLAIFSVILSAFGYNAETSMEGLASGSFGTTFLASETFFLMGPLLLAALAFLVGFRARFYNIGVEGQLYIGALFGYLAASRLGGFPDAVAIPLMLLAAAAGGTLWLALPLFMRVRLQVNEIFPTLVMNFIALDVVNWLTAGPLKDPLSGNLQTPALPQSTWLPALIKNTQLNLGAIVALEDAFRSEDRYLMSRAVGELVGLGPGLTPSADDVLAGVALFCVLYSKSRGLQAPCGPVSRAIEAQPGGRTTRLSEEFLAQAALGSGNEAAMQLCGAVLMGKPEDVEEGTRAVLAIGETSGTDTVLGVVLGVVLGGMLCIGMPFRLEARGS